MDGRVNRRATLRRYFGDKDAKAFKMELDALDCEVVDELFKLAIADGQAIVYDPA